MPEGERGPNGVYYKVPTDDGGYLNLTVTTPDDPAYFMLHSGPTSTPNPKIFKNNCYICRDPEFAMMGLPLCFACTKCGGHVAADDTTCDDCGFDAYEAYMEECGE